MSAEGPLSLLFAEVFLIWQAANYLLDADPTRSGRHHAVLSGPTIRKLAWFCLRASAAAGLTAAASGSRSGSGLAAAVFAGCVLVPVARWFWVPTRYLAEYEIVANGAFVLLARFLIGRDHLAAVWGPLAAQASERVVAGYAIAAALMIFVVRGGTYIVRGVLDRAGTMPPPDVPPVAGRNARDFERALPVDTVELNHGRLIGNVERLILVLLVANGQYTALAFFFAAKGLIRSKDVERRAWADYLILGSLTSFLVAVAAGLLIQAVFRLAEG